MPSDTRRAQGGLTRGIVARLQRAIGLRSKPRAASVIRRTDPSSVWRRTPQPLLDSAAQQNSGTRSAYYVVYRRWRIRNAEVALGAPKGRRNDSTCFAVTLRIPPPCDVASPRLCVTVRLPRVPWATMCIAVGEHAMPRWPSAHPGRHEHTRGFLPSHNFLKPARSAPF